MATRACTISSQQLDTTHVAALQKKRGDLHITFTVDFPKSLSEDQKTQLRKILPSKAAKS